ncbi:MAG TPA: GntR family transcriptional regulator [Pirellulales bacterium]|nr:GntR family transcriptional regulator [Pirellulales bacterium]
MAILSSQRLNSSTPKSRNATPLVDTDAADCHIWSDWITVIVTIVEDRYVNKLLAQTGVVEGLADFIRNEGFADGDRLPSIRELADRLKAGRNAVRDALLEVQALGLVRIEPRQGVFVQTADSKGRADRAGRVLEQSLSRDDQNLFQWVDARLAVETAVAAEAARTRRPEDLLPLRRRSSDAMIRRTRSFAGKRPLDNRSQK